MAELGPQLQTLITRPDNRELIRDQIAAILKVEIDGQRQRAESMGLESEPYLVRVFTERSEPWASFSEERKQPIVSVWADNSTFDKGSSNVVSRQRCTGTFHVDIYGFGVSEDSERGHIPADLMAVKECERTLRLARQILMSGFYTYLGFAQERYLPAGSEQVVHGRWLSSITSFQPEMEARPVERVAACRLDLEVTYNEFATEYVGHPLEILALTMERSPEGELISLQYDLSGST